MIGRLWGLITLAWMFWCLNDMRECGEIHRMTLASYGVLFTPTLIRWTVIYVVHGIPRRS